MAVEWIARLPQEDFFQALGLRPDQKYEKDGGPSLAACLRLLAGSDDAGDGESFAITQLSFWLMAATDGHAKNFSIFLRPGDAYASTPLYDVLSIFPYVGGGAEPVPLAGGGAGLRAAFEERPLRASVRRDWPACRAERRRSIPTVEATVLRWPRAVRVARWEACS